jgi:hypothetical protein
LSRLDEELRTLLEDRIFRTGDCWLWIGSVSDRGYGNVTYKGKSYKAHRLAYHFYKEDLIPGLEIDHLCKVKNCVNPDHLEQVTKQENMRRSDCVSAVNRRKTRCKRGHDFNSDNTYTHKSGKRSCRLCRNEDGKKLYYRNHEQIRARRKELYVQNKALDEEK